MAAFLPDLSSLAMDAALGLGHLAASISRRGAAMEHHHPAPVRTWPELLREVGVIVISVLIAISAEQGVEWLHWRHKVHEAEAAMHLELVGDDLPQAYARVATQPCFITQLNGVAAAVEAGQDRQAVRRLALDYVPMVRTWDDLAWTAAIAGDVGAHMPTEDGARWGLAYGPIATLRTMATREQEDLAALTPGRVGPGPMSAAEQDAILAAVQRLKMDAILVGGMSTVFLQTTHNAGAAMPKAEEDKILSEGRARYGACTVRPGPRPFSADSQFQDKPWPGR
jgi:hypothetical protein